jgi:predicted DNA-binding transcriptional regulator AlpA
MKRAVPKPHLDELIHLEPLCRWLNRSPITLRTWIRTGRFPQPIRLTNKTSVWRRETIEAWLAEREGER